MFSQAFSPYDSGAIFITHFMKEDKRKMNGGARLGTGPKPKDEMEKKVTVSFQIKRKHVEAAKAKIQPVVDKINSK